MKNFLQFVNEVLKEVDPDKKFSFYLSDKFMKTLAPLKHEYIIAKLFTDLKINQPMRILVKNPVNYLDMDNDGNISFLKHRYFEEPDPWTSTRRVKLKATKVLKDIYNQEYIDSFVKQTDVEAFANKMSSIKNSSAKVEEYRGKELLRAYNYKEELTEDFGDSCANFGQHSKHDDDDDDYGRFGGYDEPSVEEYDVYTKNPDNCGVVVVWENGKIMGRKSFQQGIQVCDSGDWKSGEFHTIMGNYYGMGGRTSKYDIMINEYLTKKYPGAVGMCQGPNRSSLCIHMETRWEKYPAFDSMYVDFEHNLLTDNHNWLSVPFKNYKWFNTYPDMDHLQAPANYIEKRKSEKSTTYSKPTTAPRIKPYDGNFPAIEDDPKWIGREDYKPS